MRVDARALMRLPAFRPRLIGSVMTGHVRKGSDIDLHLFSDSATLVTDTLENEGYSFDLERKQVVKHNESRIFTHVHVYDRFNFELTIYAADKAHYVFKSSITGKAIERASLAELEEFLQREYPGIDLESELESRAEAVDPYQLYRSLLRRWKTSSSRRAIIRRAMLSIIRCKCSSWPAISGLTTKSSCWPRFCTTSAKASIRTIRTSGCRPIGPGRNHYRANAVLHCSPHGRPGPASKAAADRGSTRAGSFARISKIFFCSAIWTKPGRSAWHTGRHRGRNFAARLFA